MVGFRYKSICFWLLLVAFGLDILLLGLRQHLVALLFVRILLLILQLIQHVQLVQILLICALAGALDQIERVLEVLDGVDVRHLVQIHVVDVVYACLSQDLSGLLR